jgi:hypothetical protein
MPHPSPQASKEQKMRKIKQSQAKSERGFRPSLHKAYMSNTIAKNAKNQAKSSQV